MKDWVKEQLEKVEQGYKAQVRNMTGAYHREIERTKEYHGRQLLELLQNADDEAENTENPILLIRLEENRLIIANNGSPFSKEGVLSLMYSDNSPKIKRRRKIGYKGLGFRAILNWSHSIWIKSGQFSIEFSKKNAREFLKSLLEKEPSLKAEMIESSNVEYPISTLAVPKWKDANDDTNFEYDTCIFLSYSSELINEDIQKQINELGIEVALFLNNLKEIKIESPERNQTIRKKG